MSMPRYLTVLSILACKPSRVAARAGGDAGTTLTNRTALANADVGERSLVIARDVEAANQVVAAHGVLVTEQGEVLAASLKSAGRQRTIAGELAEITAVTSETVDAAAAAIGRVGANAVAVKILARQVTKLARSRSSSEPHSVVETADF